MTERGEDNSQSKLKELVRRKQELEDRKDLLTLKKIEYQKQLKVLEDADAEISRQRELAASADRILKRQNFRTTFCELYKKRKELADAVEGVAELVVATIQALYPVWLADPEALFAVGVLSGTVLLNRSIKLFCAGTA